MSHLLLLAAPVLLPELTGTLDVPLLTRLGPAAQEDYQGISVSTEVDPVARADIYTALQNPSAYASHVGQVSSLHAGERGSHPGRCPGIEIVEPSTEWTAAPVVYVFSELDHALMVTSGLP